MAPSIITVVWTFLISILSAAFELLTNIRDFAMSFPEIEELGFEFSAKVNGDGSCLSPKPGLTKRLEISLLCKQARLGHAISGVAGFLEMVSWSTGAKHSKGTAIYDS